MRPGAGAGSRTGDRRGVLKAAKGGPAPSLAAIAAEITNFKTRVQQQILRGEDRMLDTESEIRDYDK